MLMLFSQRPGVTLWLLSIFPKKILPIERILTIILYFQTSQQEYYGINKFKHIYSAVASKIKKRSVDNVNFPWSNHCFGFCVFSD